MNNSSSIVFLQEGQGGTEASKQVGAVPTDVLKSILIISLLIITLISSLIPFALRRAAISHDSSARRRHVFAGVFSLLSCFGGGVFLATCLLDLFPDAIELIGDGLDQLGVKTSFPLAEFFVAIGFFIVLFIEQIALWFREKRDGQPSPDLTASGDSDQHRIVRDGNAEGSSTAGRVEQRRHTTPVSRRSVEGPLATIASVSSERRRRQSKPKDPAAVGISKPEPEKSDEHSLIVESSSEEMATSHETSVPSVAVILPSASSEPDLSRVSEDIDAIRTDVHFDPESHSTFRAVMLVMALSTHATFEGLALGLQTDASTALQIFGALCIHKCVIGFSLGMRLVQSSLKTISIVGCCLLFSSAAVLGGFIGLAITESIKSSSAAMVNGSLQGLACGTFLYITAFEILPHELNEAGHRLPKLMLLLLGFAVICLFVLLYPD